MSDCSDSTSFSGLLLMWSDNKHEFYNTPDARCLLLLVAARRPPNLSSPLPSELLWPPGKLAPGYAIEGSLETMSIEILLPSKRPGSWPHACTSCTSSSPPATGVEIGSRKIPPPRRAPQRVVLTLKCQSSALWLLVCHLCILDPLSRRPCGHDFVGRPSRAG